MRTEDACSTDIGEGDLLDSLKAIIVDSTPEAAMEDWINCDEDILTASCSELTDAELARDEARNLDDVDNADNDPDQHDVCIQKPPAIEVRKALQYLLDFSL